MYQCCVYYYKPDKYKLPFSEICTCQCYTIFMKLSLEKNYWLSGIATESTLYTVYSFRFEYLALHWSAEGIIRKHLLPLRCSAYCVPQYLFILLKSFTR